MLSEYLLQSPPFLRVFDKTRACQKSAWKDHKAGLRSDCNSFSLLLLFIFRSGVTITGNSCPPLIKVLSVTATTSVTMTLLVPSRHFKSGAITTAPFLHGRATMHFRPSISPSVARHTSSL